MPAPPISRFKPLAPLLSCNGTVLRSYEENSVAVEEQLKENLIMAATTTTSSFVLRAAAPAVPAYPMPVRRRRIDRESGRALEILSHAIEYLADEYVHHGGQLKGSDGEVQAMQLLMAANRSIYAACPEIPSFEERCAALLRRLWN
jgi:hypothetical protein